MKTGKNKIYFKKSYFLFLKICLWSFFGLIFVNFSFLLPKSPDSFFRELTVFVFLAIFINLHTSYLYPKISKKSNLFYIFLLIISISICSLFELLVFSDIFDPYYYYPFDSKKIFISTIFNITIRNLALFILFLWIEYLYQLVQLLKEKDAIHQKEIALLVEKQEFEKNFLRKKLLPHYFFNILELVHVKNNVYNYNNELLDKVKFILYYFLVDVEYEKVKLDKEIAFYQYYIELENLKHNEKITVNFDVLGDPEDFFIIPLLFEPIIGNAMKYTKRDGTGYVNITVSAENFPVLNFYCRNNYSSWPLCNNSSESGLKIFKQRLELCYKDSYTLNIFQNDDYYEVILSVNLI